MVFTLCTEAEADLVIGANPNAIQTLQANVQIWVLWAESDMEKAFGNNIGLVANFSSITTALKPWLAKVCAHRTAFYGINQDQNNWQLATTQSKLNICSSVWKGFLSDVKNKGPELIADLGLTPS